MQRSLIYPLFLFAIYSLFAGCTSNQGRKATTLLKEAREAIAVEKYDEAILLLDSINKSYPGELKVRRDAFDLEKELYELQNRARLDSIPMLLSAIEKRIDSLKAFVAVSEDFSEYGSPECFSSALRTDVSAKGISLMLKTDSLGFPSFLVIYNGNKSLQYNAAALQSADCTVTSAVYPQDQVLVYRATVNGQYYETLTIPPNDSRQMLDFLLSCSEGTKATLLLLRGDKEVHKQPITAKRLAILRNVALLSSLFTKRYELRAEQTRRSTHLANP